MRAVAPFLDEWQALLRDTRQLSAERVSAMADHAERLRSQAERVAEGGVAHHLEVCLLCLRAPALDRRGFQEALRNLSEVTWQIKQELVVASGQGAQSLAGAGGSSSIAPPPLLVDDGARPPSVAPPRAPADAVPPPPISLPGVALGLGRSPAAPPPAAERSLGLSGENPSAARGQPPAPLASAAAPEPAPGARSLPRAASSPLPAAPKPLPSPPPRAMSPAKNREKPNLMVATMFGLRAFGRGKSPGAPAPQSPVPAHSPPPRGGVLGLGRESKQPSGAAPAWLESRVEGLPDLGTGGRPAPSFDNDDLDQRLRKLRSGAEPSRRGRSRSEPSSSESSAPRRSGPALETKRSASRASASFAIPWWVGLVAVAGVGLVVVAVLIFGRTPAGASAESAPTEPAAALESEIPRSRLLDDKERMRTLISQVHSYGGEESPELAALLNEEAALVFEVLEKSCDEPGDKCKSAVPVVAGTLPSGAPQHQIHDLFQDRTLTRRQRAQAGHLPKWLAGLSIPVIGAEDEPAVRRWFEYYTQNEVGREVFKTLLFRCGAYQQLIEKTLLQYGLPRALMALVMTESACVSGAESPVGARGLWQFMPATARAYHLQVKENVVDERISPPKATEAGVKFLADLYRKMGSWELALASYNMGPFGLAARIRRAGGDVTFWDLADAGLLPEETAKYVPRIQAYALILENLARFDFSTAQSRAPEMTADLEVPPGTRLGLIARSAGTSLQDLMQLNPDIVGTTVPDLPGGRFLVQVPKEAVFRARTTLDQLLEGGDDTDQCVPSAFDWGRDLFTAKMAAACRKRRKQAAP